MDIFVYFGYFSYICSMKNKDKKLEIRFYVSEETYKKLVSKADELEMTLAGYVKLRTIELTKDE